MVKTKNYADICFIILIISFAMISSKTISELKSSNKLLSKTKSKSGMNDDFDLNIESATIYLRIDPKHCTIAKMSLKLQQKTII